MVTSRSSSITSAAVGWRWAMLGSLIGIALAVSLFAPARWLAAGVSQWTHGHLQLVNARGTVWTGTAGLVFASGVGGAEPVSLPGTLGWTVRPRWDGLA